MTVLWLLILVVYGIVAGFSNINPLMWLLLIPLLVQDFYDRRKK